MAQSLDVHGQFWLPDHKDHQVAGVLTFSPDDGGQLALIGTLELEAELLDASSKDYSRILGADEKHLYTLDGCLRTRSTINFRGFGSRQGFYVGRIIRGYAVEKGQPVMVDGLAVWMANLIDWVRIDGLSECSIADDPHGPIKRWEISGDWQPSLSGTFPAGSLHLKHQLTKVPAEIHGLTLTQDNYLRLEFAGELPLDDALDFASDLRDLVSIATGRVAGYQAIQLFHPQFTITRPGRTINMPAELFLEWIAKVEPGLKPLRERHMLFTFDQFGGMAGVERWMPVAERYRELLGRVMNTIYPSSMFVQDRVLNRVASLEALHKQWSGRSEKLVDALQELAAYAGAPFEQLVGLGKVTTWCQKAKDERHDIAHHLGRQPHLDMSELFYIGQGAYWLFVMCLLREAQAPQAVFDHLVSCDSFRFESRELQGIL